MATPLVLPNLTPTPEQIRTEFDLPFSGKHVIILRGKGRDQRLALMSAGPGANPHRILQAITAQICIIDGKKIKMEDVDEMDFDDAMVISSEVGKALNPMKNVPLVELGPGLVETDQTEANDSQLSS